MIELQKYNPCLDRIKKLEIMLKSIVKNDKKIKIKYDNKCFITNVSEGDIVSPDFSGINNGFINDKGLVIFRAEKVFFIDGIMQCPQMKFQAIQDLYLEGITKRMYAQLEFDFFSNGFDNDESIEMCNCIFKSIYTNSITLKLKNIKSSLEIFNKLQKSKYINRKIIYGIIYAVYDYYNSTLK